MVTLASVLDPVVSTTQWCGLSSDPAYHGLTHVHLWRWFTNETYTGYWFGVPMVNYMSWFVGMYVFTFMSRLDDDGPRGIVRHYDRWYKYVGAALATLAIVFGIEFVLKIGIDVLLVRGREFLVGHVPVPGKLHWEFAVMASLLVLNLVVVWRFGRTHPNPQKLRWVAIVPPAAVLAFCLWCLFHEPLPVLCAVWLLSAATSVLVVFWPVKFTVEKHREQRQAETASV
jgi:hypothetical protein